GGERTGRLPGRSRATARDHRIALRGALRDSVNNGSRCDLADRLPGRRNCNSSAPGGCLLPSSRCYCRARMGWPFLARAAAARAHPGAALKVERCNSCEASREPPPNTVPWNKGRDDAETTARTLPGGTLPRVLPAPASDPGAPATRAFA